MNKRLLIVNIYFSPHSFGGATIVAEEVALCLKRNHAWNILVVTSHNDASLPPYGLRRYRSKGLNVISINLPKDLNGEEALNNPKFNRILEDIIELYQPHRVHVHCTQSLGCGYFDSLKQKKIKFIVTLHDCWWICERQFMLASDGRYCFQKKIDLKRCQYCAENPEHLHTRNNYLKNQLTLADQLLAPSDFQRSLYLDNGFASAQVIVNKNGIRLPGGVPKKSPRPDGKITFAFIGGPIIYKGSAVMLKAFNALTRHDQYMIYVVDAARTMGTTWKDNTYWKVPGSLQFVPPYDQDSLDDFFAQVDILLFPSQWKESFGLTVREALSRNVWVIATESGGVMEDIRDGVNGKIIPLDGDHYPLRNAIKSCLDRKPEYWKQFSNPYRLNIRSFNEQADEIERIMSNL